jgi:hypothetical protein
MGRTVVITTSLIINARVCTCNQLLSCTCDGIGALHATANARAAGPACTA